MTLLHQIQVAFAVLRTFTPWHGDTETPAERDARLGVIAAAIVIAAPDDREMQITLANQARFETNLAAHVHRGECEQHPDSWVGECDARWEKVDGKRVRVFAARGLWQAHRPPRPDVAALWDHSLGSGLGETANAARLAAFFFRGRSCGGNLAQRYSAQGGVGCHATPSGTKRAAAHRKLRVEWARASKGVE
jgi:hypothetical protein